MSRTVCPRRAAAELFLARARREPDLIGLVLGGQGAAFAYATTRPRVARADACPVCDSAHRGKVGMVMPPRPRSVSPGAPARLVLVECPLCQGTALLDAEYSNFIDFFRAAQPHDAVALLDAKGRPLPIAAVLEGEWINRAAAQQLLEPLP